MFFDMIYKYYQVFLSLSILIMFSDLMFQRVSILSIAVFWHSKEHLWKTQMQTESTLEDMETQRGVYQAGTKRKERK